tara:strand:+ start:201 stop:656 length:456 start_codon:yes stop_codon:yes gene_type:complete
MEYSIYEYDELNYPIKFAYKFFQTEELLLKEWNDLTNAVAMEIQSVSSTSIEIWNIYIVFLVGEKVSDQLKNLIEQDKFSARKIVVEHTRCLEDKVLIEDEIFEDWVVKNYLMNPIQHSGHEPLNYSNELTNIADRIENILKEEFNCQEDR